MTQGFKHRGHGIVNGRIVPPAIMGILNITPDSFSDGGDYKHVDAAVERAQEMVKQGAGIIDIGGESTRPGAQRVSSEEQKRRILPVVKSVSDALPDVLISVDTTSQDVAEAALERGAGMINDISAGREDPAILQLAAEQAVPVCLMHMQNDPQTMQDNPHYEDVVTEVCDFLHARAQFAMVQGISPQRIVLDPGIGFGKTFEHNIALLAHLDRICALGFPVLLGASRKRFIGELDPSAAPRQRVAGSCAATVLAAMQGVAVFRVHDVFEHAQALRVVQAVFSQQAT